MTQFDSQRTSLGHNLQIIVLAASVIGAVAPASAGDPPPEDFVAARRAHSTRLAVRGPSPQEYEPLAATETLQVVTYESGSLLLRGYLELPRSQALRTSSGVPALVYFHGAFALGAADVADTRSFIDAGFAVFAPALRGENGNPGSHELLYGELDDALAAIRYARTHPGIDGGRVIVAGHSAGGMLAALVALVPDAGVLDTGSIGGFYLEEIFDHLAIPFEDSREERRLRLAYPWMAGLANPHFACFGSDDAETLRAGTQAARRAKGASAPFEVRVVAGDHFTSLEPCMEMYLERVHARLAVSTASYRCPEGTRHVHKSLPIGSADMCVDSAERLHGPATVRDQDGNVRRRDSWLHGSKHGTWETYFDSGGLASRIDFRHGSKTGVATSWFENGLQKNFRTFKDDVQDGPIAEWDESGVQTVAGQFTDGTASGMWSFHDPSRNVIHTRTFVSGRPISTEPLTTDSSCEAWFATHETTRIQFAAEVLMRGIRKILRNPEVSTRYTPSIAVPQCVAERSAEFANALDSGCVSSTSKLLFEGLTEEAKSIGIEIAALCVRGE